MSTVIDALMELVGLLRIQLRVIGALLFRELHTRYGRENIGFLWVIGEPILFCAGVAILWTAIRAAHEHGLPMTAFVISGYVPLTMWRHCTSRAVKAFESNGSLLFHRQVTPLDIIAARLILEVMGSLAAGLIVSAGAISLGFMRMPQNWGLLYLGLLYHIAFSAGFALVIAALSETSDLVEKSLTAFMYLSLPFSGAFTMVVWLPQHLRAWMLLSPSVDSTEMIRGGEFGSAVHVEFDLWYTSCADFLLVLLGVSLTLRVRRHLAIQ